MGYASVRRRRRAAARAEPAVSDTSFFTDGRPFLTSRQAALYVGYEPSANALARQDPAMWAFYSWSTAHQIPRLHRGRMLMFRRADLDAALGEPFVKHAASRRGQIQLMALRDAAGLK